MKNVLTMKEQDLVELYQLLRMYRMVYSADMENNPEGLMQRIRNEYMQKTGNEIAVATNPRGAGRKPVYKKDFNKQILDLRENGLSLRKIATVMGCSVRHVQDVIL